MKVLKYGKIQPKQVSCPNCNSLLEYTDADLDYTSLPCRFGEDKVGLKCPVCSETILLELYSREGCHYVRKEDGKLHFDGMCDEDA